MEVRTAGALIGLENRDVEKLTCGFDPYCLRNMPTIRGEDGTVNPQPEVSSTSGGTNGE